MSERFQLWYIEVGGVPMPTTTEVAARWLEDPDNVRVAQDTVGPYWISTVFLGLDHGFARGGPPILYETMAFGVPETRYFEILGREMTFRPEQDMERYATREAALEGHKRMVERWSVAWDELEAAFKAAGG